MPAQQKEMEYRFLGRSGLYNQGIPEGTRVTLKGFGWLREEFEKEETRQNIEKVKLLAPIAQSLGCSLAQLALAWCLKNPHVSTVITGASRKEQVTENMQALEVAGQLTPDVMEQIEQVLQNKPEAENDER